MLAFPARKVADASAAASTGLDADLLAADLPARVIGILRGYDPQGAEPRVVVSAGDRPLLLRSMPIETVGRLAPSETSEDKRMLCLVRSLAVIAALTSVASVAHADVPDRDGWVVIRTDHAFANMVERLNTAVRAAEMGLVTRASASAGAKGRGITIPGNMIVGVYRNDFAVRMLETSVAAGIEAPIRFYLTERDDGGTTLSYKTPTTVFSPYFDEGGDALRELAVELDGIFEGIAGEATAE